MDQYWQEISIDTTSGGMEALAAYLTACGIVGLVYEDERDLYDFADEQKPFWDDLDDELLNARKGVSRIKFYVTDDEEGKIRSDDILAGLEAFKDRTNVDVGSLKVSYTRLREEDWSQNWKKYYEPFPVGEKLYIVPEWQRGEKVPDDRKAVYLNPGLIFGTGSHGTTRLCLEAVEKYVQNDDNILDLGTGSGILAIASIVLGAKHAKGCDIDHKASKVAKENASFNAIYDEFEVFTGDIIHDLNLQRALKGKYDIVLANIVADVIIPLTDIVSEYMTQDGYFITTGIIDARANDVIDALKKNNFNIIDIRHKDGWTAVISKLH